MTDSPIGLCWSYDPSFAKPYEGSGWDNNNIDVKLEGIVHFDDIDWPSTMALFTRGKYTASVKSEIRLLPTATVDVVIAKQTHVSNGRSWNFEPGMKLLRAADEKTATLSMK